jgi:hypothetical protein
VSCYSMDFALTMECGSSWVNPNVWPSDQCDRGGRHLRYHATVSMSMHVRILERTVDCVAVTLRAVAVGYIMRY